MTTPIHSIPTQQNTRSETETECVAEFMASLDDKDRIIHQITAKMLGNRYDPVRTTAYLRWIKTRKVKE